MSELFCTICKNKQIFRSMDHLEAHIAEFHLALLPFSCTLCEYGGRYPTETAIMAHMRACHQIEDEFKFYSIFNNETIGQRKKAAEMLRRCLANGEGKSVPPDEQQKQETIETDAQTRITQSEVSQQQKPNPSGRKKKNSEEPDKVNTPSLQSESVFAIPDTQPRPAKIPRLQTPTPQPVLNHNRPIISPSAPLPAESKDNGLLQIPSVIRQALQQGVGGSSQHSAADINQKSTMNALGEKKKTASNNKRNRKEEKKNSEKKISETATKGGYIGFDIEHLFSDSKADHNVPVTDDEHSEGDTSNTSKEEAPKICRGMQQDLDLAPTFFSSKISTRLGLVLHKAESEWREFQSKNSRGQQGVQKESHGVESFVKRQGELSNREIKQELDMKIKQRDKQLEEREKDKD